MHSLRTASTIIVLFLLYLIAFAYSSEPPQDSNLEIEIKSNDSASIRIFFPIHNKTDAYHQNYVILPFALERISWKPREVIVNIETFQESYTLVSIIAPSIIDTVEIEAESTNIVKLNSGSDLRRLSLDFNFDTMPEIIRWVFDKEETVHSFETIQVVFPPLVDMSTVAENHPANYSPNNIRTYLYSNLIETDGKLEIQYIGATSNINLIITTLVAIVAGILTDLIPLFQISEENIRNKKKTFMAISLISWLITSGIIYFWIILGNGLLNIGLPAFVISFSLSLGSLRFLWVNLKQAKK